MRLGKNSFTWTEGYEWLEVGNYSSIAADCYFHHNDNHYYVDNKKYVSSFNFKTSQPVKVTTIGHDVWIGKGVNVLTGITIGDGAIIGAHSVVTKDVPPFALAVGNPAVIKRFRFNRRQIAALNKIKWWNWEDDKIKEARDTEAFEDIDLFIKKYDQTTT